MNPFENQYLWPFMGIKVIVSSAAVGRSATPVRKLEFKLWMQKGCYFYRVQKKWLKRFGTVEVPCMYMLGDHTVVMHPEVFEKVKHQMQLEEMKCPTPSPR